MGIVKNYSIHNVIDIRMTTTSSILKKLNFLKELNHPLSYFEVSEDVDPDIYLNIGPFEPELSNSFVVDHKYYIKENYFYTKEIAGRGYFEIEISGFEEGRTVINFNGKFFGLTSFFINLIAQEMLLMPTIIYKLSEKGYYLIHAGGISRNKNAYVFTGRGGSSKTEIVVDFVRHGFEYLGDDWVIIHEGKVLPFPKSFHTFIFSLKTGCLPTESFSSFIDKIRYFNYLRKYPNYDVLKVSTPSKLKALFFIIKTNRGGVNRKTLDSNSIVKRLIANNTAEIISGPTVMSREFGRYYNYLSAYSYIFPESKIASWLDDFGKGIEKNTKKISNQLIELPGQYEPSTFQEILKVVEAI